MKLNPFPAIGRALARFGGWIHAAVCALTTEDGRKGWAMLAALGCCVVMTAEVAVGLWALRHHASYIFWLACSAQAVNFVVITGLMVLLGVKRKTNVTLPLPGGGSISLGMDDTGQPVVVQTTPIATPAPTVPVALDPKPFPPTAPPPIP